MAQELALLTFEASSEAVRVTESARLADVDITRVSFEQALAVAQYRRLILERELELLGSSTEKIIVPRPSKPHNPAKVMRLTQADSPRAVEPTRPAFTILRSEKVERFWQTVDAHCPPLTEDHVEQLEDLIAPLASGATKPTPASTAKSEKRDDGDELLPLTSRLVASLLEENHMVLLSELEPTSDTLLSATPAVLAKQHHLTNPAILEKRLRKELVTQGLLDGQESPPVEQRNAEAKLAQLRTALASQLTELLDKVKEEAAASSIRRRMDAMEVDIDDAYRKLCLAKAKRKQQPKKERDAFYRLMNEWYTLAEQAKQ